MAYAKMYDQNNRVIGLWLDNRADAENSINVATLLTMSGAHDLAQEVLAGNTKVTPNTVDGRGGFFVFVGHAAMSEFEPRNRQQESGRKWWKFWQS